MPTLTQKRQPSYEDFSKHFHHWQKIGDLVDQCIDLMLNLRQSGHPGGSRSKVPIMVASTLGAGMRWDIRRPEHPFGDRFVLVAGHCNPATYAMLAVYNEALRAMHERTGDPRYLVPKAEQRMLTWEDLLWLRHNGHLPGHAEMEGKTLFFKFNTGPSGHGAPAALGEALALKHAGTDTRVFALEGEGGHTAGCHHEVKNSAYGLGLDNLIYLFDWNDHGIDEFANSSVAHGTPVEWFESYGWRVAGTEDGEDYGAITKAAARGRARRGHRWAARDGLDEDPQGPRLLHVRRPFPRQGARAQLRAVLALPRRFPGQVRRRLRGLRQDRGPGRGRDPRADAQLVRGGLRRHAQGHGPGRVPGEHPG